MPTKRTMLRGAMVVCLGLAVSLIGMPQALAVHGVNWQGPPGGIADEGPPDEQNTGLIPTSANASSTGTPAHIECAWALPDTDDYDANGVQYGDDDDPLLEPGYPCNGLPPQQAEGVQHMIQVLPNSHDLPSEKAVELWTAVDHPAGVAAIDDVYWKVFHADGSFKVQVHGTAAPCDTAGVRAMFQAAVDTGQIAVGSVEGQPSDDSLINLCLQDVKRYYGAPFTISKHQPCGEYRVESHAVANGVEAPVKNFYIDVLCFFDLEVDFTSVAWGQIIPGTTKVLAGNTVWDPGFGRPSVRNTGNTGMGVGLLYAPLVEQGPPGPKTITVFDAKFGRTPLTLQSLDPIAANTRVNFDSNRERTLCANEIGKLDLSVHPQAGLPNGTYLGNMTVYGFHQPHTDCPGFLPNVVTPPPPL